MFLKLFQLDTTIFHVSVKHIDKTKLINPFYKYPQNAKNKRELRLNKLFT